MISSFHWLLYSALLVTGIAIFLTGFFPVKISVPAVASIRETCLHLDYHCFFDEADEQAPDNCCLQASYERIIFILIDALRADFVLPDVKQSWPRNVAQMKFVNTLIQRNETVSFVALAHPPTVTLPRVKALMTGAVPGFVDVVLNFDTAELRDDNLLTQLRHAGKKIIFYGDETWIHLFPGMFTRYDGTTSFFVSDYTEVDRNVTRHIDAELQRTDWDVLVLHYLGLDHIGHLAGPYSPLVQPKLDEMDDIVRRILLSVTDQDKKRRLPTLIVLCGDHGMSDQGSHGGSSASEVSTPFILMSSSFLGGRGVPYSGQTVQQVDIVPTLALLLGLPIPQSSVGAVAFDALSDFINEKKLLLAFINAQQLLRTIKNGFENYVNDEGYKQLQIALSMHRNLLNDSANALHNGFGDKTLQQYQKAIHLMRDRLIMSSVNFDFYTMIVGAATVWLICLHLVFDQSWSMRHEGGGLVLALFWIMCALIHISLCTSSCANSVVCGKYGILLPITTVCIATLFGTLLSSVLGIMLLWRQHCKLRPASVSSVFWVSSTLHVLSLMSSSFVEEEHQTWYFITMTTCVVGSACFGLRWLNPSRPRANDADYTRGRVTTNSSCAGKEHEAVCYQRAALSTLFVALLCRIMRSWNQTGDKWSHLLDVGDWLVRPENKSVLSLLTVLALFVLSLTVWKQTRHVATTLVFVFASVFVYCYHAAQKAFHFPHLYDAKDISKGVTEARAVYVLIAVQTSLTVVLFLARSSRRRRNECVIVVDGSSERRETGDSDFDHRFAEADDSTAVDGKKKDGKILTRDCAVVSLWQHVVVTWTMLMLLLMRPHNIALVALLSVTRICVHSSARYMNALIDSPVVTSLVYAWFGQAAFFYQGNSNSLATIDVAAGYVGLSDYNPVIICLLMFASTYAGPIYWLLALNEQLATTFVSRYMYAVRESCRTVLTTKCLVIAVYIVLVTMQRYHLFVWTVFSPKLLYEASSTLVTVLILTGCLAVATAVTRRLD